MKLRYLMPLMVAVSIDAFDFLMALALFALFAAAPATAIGVVGGKAACGTVCGALGGVAGAILDVIPITHGIVSSITEPLGEGVGQVMAFAVDATFGTGLIALLIFLKLMSLKDILSFKRLPFMLGKLLPFFDILPFYTGLVVTLIMQKEARETGGALGAAMGVATVALGKESVGQAAGASRASIVREEGVAAPRPARSARPVMQDVRVPPAANETRRRAPLAA